ncbi:MAG: DUF192 domain-containing protein [Candidatus Jorgensenbacteria bacterium]
MMVKNLTRGTVMSARVAVARTFGEKSTGLRGGTEPSALFMKTRWGIHTFGMRFSIDCLVLDDGFAVVAVRENVAPNRFFFWNPRYRNVLEFPAGTIRKTGTRVGDKMAMVE